MWNYLFLDSFDSFVLASDESFFSVMELCLTTTTVRDTRIAAAIRSLYLMRIAFYDLFAA